MMLAKSYSSAKIVFCILCWLEICLNLIANGPRGRVSLLDTTFTSLNVGSNIKRTNTFLFVQAQAHHKQSNLFYAPNQDLDGGGVVPLYESRTGVKNHDGHFEESEYSGFKSSSYDELASESNSNQNHNQDQDLSREDNELSNNNYQHSSSASSSNSEDDDENEIGHELGAASDRLSLDSATIRNACKQNKGIDRKYKLNNTYLTHCFRYKLEYLISNEIFNAIMSKDADGCERILDEFVQLDKTINQFDSLFIKLLSRYNCHNGYSVKWNCDDCKKAYKDWLCATHLPFYMAGERIKPCISFCERVEQRCPYLHPITREQYGGQPVFICRDPNIPFVPEITPDIPYSEPGKCYDLCHLSDNLTELIIDSLSKYEYDKCPDKSSIASDSPSGSFKVPGLSDEDASDYVEPNQPDEGEPSEPAPSNKTKLMLSSKVVHVHNKKLEELREVLANYQNQAKTHRYHADHSSIDHSKTELSGGHSSK